MTRGAPQRPEDHARRRDAAFVLPFFGVLLLLPPFLNLFTRERLLWGVPLEVLYIFGVWLGLVAGAAILSRRMPRQDAGTRDPDGGAAPPPDPAPDPTPTDP